MCMDITHPDDEQCSAVKLASAMADGKPYVLEQRYVRPGRSLIWVRNTVSVVVDERGRPKYHVVVSIDITDRKKAEARLRLLLAVSDAVLTEDDPNRIVAAAMEVFRGWVNTDRSAWVEVEKESSDDGNSVLSLPCRRQAMP